MLRWIDPAKTGMLLFSATGAALLLVIVLEAAPYHLLLQLMVTLPGVAALSLCAWRFLKPSRLFLRPSTFVLLAFAVFFIPEVYLGRDLWYAHAGSELLVMKAGFLVWSGLIAFLLGTLLPRSTLFDRVREVFNLPIRPGRAMLVSALLCGTGLFAFLSLCRMLGIPPIDYLRGFYTETGWGGITNRTRPILMVSNLVTVAGLICSWVVWQRAAGRKIRLPAWLILFIPILLNAARGSRGNVILIVLALFIAYLHGRRSFSTLEGRKRMRVLCLVLGAVVYAGLLGMTWARDTAWGEIHPENEQQSMLNSFSYFNRLLLATEMIPDQSEFLGGRTLMAAAVFPVPRFLWPEKPFGFGTVMAEWVGFLPGSIGIPATFIGELYANFDWLGVIVCMLFFGWIVKNIDAWILEARSSSLLCVVFAVNLWFCFGMMRGDFYTAFSGWITNLAVIAAVIVISRARRYGREDAHAAA